MLAMSQTAIANQAMTLMFTLFYLLSMLPMVLAQSTDPSYYYNLCAPSTCNNLSISYPFLPPQYCHNPVTTPTCVNNEYLLLSSPQYTDSFRVLGKISNDTSGLTIKVASNALFSCGAVSKPGFAVGQSVFSLSNSYTYGTHLNCTRRPTTSLTIQPVSCLGCAGQASENVCFYSTGFVNVPDCEPYYIFVPEGFNVSSVTDLRGFLQRGYELRYTKPVYCLGCEATGGRCGSSPAGSFVCFCPSTVHRQNCTDGIIEDLQTWFPQRNGSKLSKGKVAAISASASVAILILLALVMGFVIHRKRKIETNRESGTNEQTKNEEGFKNLVTDMSPTRYSYSQVKKFTSNFSSKLGEGGFGSVYKGTIKEHGSSVHIAVKVLKSSKQSEKQFMNEVATIGRIHHNNLVRMLGYCVQGSNRALIYEFMEKGSLEKYIHVKTKEEEEKEKGNIKRLSPQEMHTIALETAKGIMYLHQGCRSRILHCDIKPHNVLLDSNLSPKVSDFGLARMINKDHSHVSITAARGTPGYAAPEMWSKSYGQVTEKSDVYSYGMLLLEMVGGRKNYDPELSAQSQVYFPEWAYKQVEKGEFLMMRRGDWIECGGEEREVLKKICVVGLWCIQHIPSNRPSMSRVIQMLEGIIEIETPPLPFPKTTGKAHNDHISDSTVYLSASRGNIELNEDYMDGGK